MLREVRGRYEKGKLVMADGEKPPPDGAEVVVVYQTAEAAAGGRELYGTWAGRFADGFDFEKEIRDIRSGWHERLGDSHG